MEELRAFRRQAEIKIRAEIQANAEAEDAAGKPRSSQLVQKNTLTPKTKKYIFAKPAWQTAPEEWPDYWMVSSRLETWENVQDQLLAHPPAVVKKLWGQLMRKTLRPASRQMS